MLIHYYNHFSKLPDICAGFVINDILVWPSRSSFTCRRTLRKMKSPGTSPIKRQFWKISLRKMTTIEMASFLPRNTMCTNTMSYKFYFFVSKLLYFALKKKYFSPCCGCLFSLMKRYLFPLINILLA